MGGGAVEAVQPRRETGWRRWRTALLSCALATGLVIGAAGTASANERSAGPPVTMAPRAGEVPTWVTATTAAPGASLTSSKNGVESAHVSGPIPSGPVGDPSHNYPFISAGQDLTGRGYTEQEFFLSGTTFGGPYTSRMLVRRPTSPARFSGTVVVEWLNVSAGYDLDPLWENSADQILRDGDAYVGVDAQIEGVYTPKTGLKAFSPARYAPLQMPRIGTFVVEPGAYGIFAQALQTIRHPRGADPLGGLPAKTIVATGTSQSALALLIYSSTVGVTIPGLVDAYLITALSTGTAAHALRLPETILTSASPPFIVADLGVPVLLVNTETDPSPLRLMPDTRTFRLWEVAGSSHVDYDGWLRLHALSRRDLNLDVPADPGCAAPPLSRIPFRYAQDAALVHITRWARTGTPPPSQPGFTYNGIGTIVRDSVGNALGGVRLPEQDVPTATNRGDNTGPGFCFLFGQHISFTPERLRALYPNHASYVQQVRAATARAVAAGVLLPADADEVIAAAQAANVPPATSQTSRQSPRR
jgi:Alpha/beta hydrolase domain